jgi:hypothetical protein
MSNLLELGFKLEGKGLRVWTYPNEEFVILYLQWITTDGNMKTLVTNFQYVFKVVAGETQKSLFDIHIFTLEKVTTKTLEHVFLESVYLDSVAPTKETKMPFSITLLAQDEEAENSLHLARRNRKDFECDDSHVKDGWFRCCLWGERRKSCLALWDNSIIAKSFLCNRRATQQVIAPKPPKRSCYQPSEGGSVNSAVRWLRVNRNKLIC